MSTEPVIETAALTKSYGSARGIEDVTFTVEPGEVFGFLGPNGAGKTTTIRTLLDLLHPTSGTARLFGLDSRRHSVRIRARLGNLPGDFGFGHQSTGIDAVRLLARLRGLDGTGRAEELAARFRADLSRPLGQLSRGNRQKVGLILATFHRPELLILDEPTSGLDPLMQEEFLTLVREERERGCAVFISSHELDEVERVCDRVGIVRGGRLIAVERISELLGKARRRITVEVGGRGGARVAGSDRRRRRPGAIRRPCQLHLRRRPGPVVKALAGVHVVDLEATHPTLEEIFLTYYEDGVMSASSQLLALIGAHLSDRRRSVLAWGLPLGLMSAFIVAIFPSVEDALSRVTKDYPAGLKEAFGIGELTNVEQYLHAEMLSLIVPLAMGYLAVRAISSGLSGAAETGRLDVLLSAPVSGRGSSPPAWPPPRSSWPRSCC